jgi:hypothetical protein
MTRSGAWRTTIPSLSREEIKTTATEPFFRSNSPSRRTVLPSPSASPPRAYRATLQRTGGARCEGDCGAPVRRSWTISRAWRAPSHSKRGECGLARNSHTLAGAGSVLAAPRVFRALPIQPVSAAALKTPLIPWGTTMPFAIIPQWYEKCGLRRLQARSGAKTLRHANRLPRPLASPGRKRRDSIILHLYA